MNPRYENKRSEMYFEAIQWIKDGGALPDVPELLAALSQTTYTFRGDRLLLEPKEQVKARLGYSPDDADAFALTFSQPVAKAYDPFGYARGHSRGPDMMLCDYDPLDPDWMEKARAQGAHFCIVEYDELEW
jgi:hypothetical protein